VPRRCGTGVLVSWKPTLPYSLSASWGWIGPTPRDFRRHRHLPEEDTDVETVTVDENRRSAIKRPRAKSPASAGEQPGLIVEASG
jgi:hypothetical protein